MCGILGYIGGEVNSEAFLKCLNTLEHRGPDGYGIEKIDGATLGHRRLSILDLSEKGKQPMSYKNGRYWITYNGEIYNFIEIRKELLSLGYTFASDSDTEVILASFLEWKEKCLDKFNGMWAFSIWDSQEKVLFISRDRFGVKPLFYATKDNVKKKQNSNGFVFASEMKAIIPFLNSITPNKEIITHLDKIFYYESTDVCLIDEIKRFPAGHYAWVKDGDISLHRYWNTLDYLEKNTDSYEKQVEKGKDIFLNACAIRLRSDVTMGTALSGGLDSSAVFSTVAHLEKENKTERASKDWQHAFCASFPNSSVDEKKYAEKVTNHLGIGLHTVDIDPMKHLEKLYEYIYQCEDLYITSPIPFVQLYGEMRKQGVIVTLDGHGADEFFGGYNFDFMHILYDELFNPCAVVEVFRTYFNTQIENEDITKTSKIIFVVKTLGKTFIKRIIGYKNKSRYATHPTWEKLDYFTQKLVITSHETVLPTLLRNYDRYSMINGVEIRMPFMDYRLVTFALSLPWHSKLRNGYTKSIVRDIVKEYLPFDVAFRKSKIGWNSPTKDWLQGPLKEFCLHTVESEEFKMCEYVNSNELRERLTTILENKNTTYVEAEHWWRDMSPFFWEQGFLRKVTKLSAEINI